MNNKKSGNKKQTPAKQGGRTRSPKKNSGRWSFELGKTEWGPFQTAGLKASSRNVGPSEMVGLASRSFDPQRSMPRIRSEIKENGNVVEVLTGTDLVGTVSSSEAGNEAGDILFTQEISPSLIDRTRLLQFSSLYQRYRFKGIQFKYSPIANATQSGQLLGFSDFDVDTIIDNNSADNLSVGAAHQGQAINQIWEVGLYGMGQMPSFTDLFTDPTGEDPRLSIQGVFYLLAASILPPNIPLGNIYVDYEVEFSIPQLNENSGIASAIGYSAGGWTASGLQSPATSPLLFGSIKPDVTFGTIALTSGTAASGPSLTISNIIPGNAIEIQYSITGAVSLTAGIADVVSSNTVTGMTAAINVAVLELHGAAGSNQVRVTGRVFGAVSSTTVTLTLPPPSTTLPLGTGYPATSAGSYSIMSCPQSASRRDAHRLRRKIRSPTKDRVAALEAQLSQLIRERSIEHIQRDMLSVARSSPSSVQIPPDCSSNTPSPTSVDCCSNVPSARRVDNGTTDHHFDEEVCVPDSGPQVSRQLQHIRVDCLREEDAQRGSPLRQVRDGGWYVLPK